MAPLSSRLRKLTTRYCFYVLCYSLIPTVLSDDPDIHPVPYLYVEGSLFLLYVVEKAVCNKGIITVVPVTGQLDRGTFSPDRGNGGPDYGTVGLQLILGPGLRNYTQAQVHAGTRLLVLTEHLANYTGLISMETQKLLLI